MHSHTFNQLFLFLGRAGEGSRVSEARGRAQAGELAVARAQDRAQPLALGARGRLGAQAVALGEQLGAARARGRVSALELLEEGSDLVEARVAR